MSIQQTIPASQKKKITGLLASQNMKFERVELLRISIYKLWMRTIQEVTISPQRKRTKLLTSMMQNIIVAELMIIQSKENKYIEPEVRKA